MSSTEGHRPRLNHVAITMDRALLDEAGRAELLAFYGDVFGWSEGDNTGEDGNPLIMYTGAFGEFVYLLPGEPALSAPALDHFGYQVATLDELRTDRDARPRPARPGRARADHRRTRVHDARSRARLHAHECLHRLRAAPHDRAAAPPPARLTGARSAGARPQPASVAGSGLVGSTPARRAAPAAMRSTACGHGLEQRAVPDPPEHEHRRARHGLTVAVRRPSGRTNASSPNQSPRPSSATSRPSRMTAARPLSIT